MLLVVHGQSRAHHRLHDWTHRVGSHARRTIAIIGHVLQAQRSMIPHTFALPLLLALSSGDSLRQQIESRIAQVPGAIVAVSLRDLRTGDSLDINADSSFHAASTMTV